MLFDGRLDHREELAAALAIDASELARLSDAGLVGAAWAKWGSASPARFYGDFAAVVFDRQEQRLSLFRDPFGRRPLHYYSDGERVAVAPLPGEVIALSGIPRALDVQKLVDIACGLYLHAAQSCFENVRSVEPGEIVSFTPDSCRAHRYYVLGQNVRPVRYRSDRQYVEQMQELLARSTDSVLRDSGKLAASMSGGLDSTSVAVLAAQRLPASQPRLPVYTSVPDPDWDGRAEAHVYADERHYAQAVARHCPTLDLSLVDAAGKGIFDVIDRVNQATQLPHRNVMNAIWMDQLCARAKDHGAQTMLEGGMGNVAFSYAGLDAASQLLRAMRLPSLVTQVWAEADHRPLRALKTAGSLGLKELRSRVPTSLRARMLRRGGAMRLPPEARAIRSECIQEHRVIERAVGRLQDDIRLMSGLERDRWMMTLKNHVFAAGSSAHGWQTLHGLQWRDPLADRKLIEWSLGVPDWVFCKGKDRRLLAKQAMAGLLPDEVLYKPQDVGRQSADWHLRVTRDLDRIGAELDRFSRDPMLAALFDIERLQSHLRSWPEHTPTTPSDPAMATRRELPMVISIGRFALANS